MAPPLAASTLDYTLGSYLASQGKKSSFFTDGTHPAHKARPLLGPTLFPAILGLSCCLSACSVVASSLPRGGLDTSRP